MDLFSHSGAKFSADRKYRYSLNRWWDPDNKPTILFIGLNPSTANETTDDPTIRRVVDFADRWGYGGIIMMNLFALVSPYPQSLLTDPDPLGDNDKYLHEVKDHVQEVVFAWGSFPEAQQRAKEVIKMFPGALCLVKNRDGSPRHPLYVPSNTKLIKFE